MVDRGGTRQGVRTVSTAIASPSASSNPLATMKTGTFSRDSEVVLDRRLHAAKVQIIVGSRATTVTEYCSALLDTGISASFILQTCLDKILACGSASGDGVSTSSKTWGGFMSNRSRLLNGKG